MRVARAWIGRLAVLIGVALLLYVGWAWSRRNPEDVPWTTLDLGRPIGAFTGRKLTGLSDEPALCRDLLGRAGVRFILQDPKGAGQCRAEAPVRLGTGGARTIALAPAATDMACPVAAALALWEWQVVQPAARRRFGVPVTEIAHLGTYSCRRMYGRDTGDWSEHARANAIDIAGFRLADGRRIRVLDDWEAGSVAERAFLRDVRDGACRLFATVLSPDYNAAHRDHLHLDQADRGPMGWRACR
jgi:hypothetical protein